MTILCSVISAFIVLLKVCSGIPNAWLDYIVTVEQPVTLVTHSEAIRHNGTCCNPADPTDCIICPDDPSVQFTLQVCFRTGYHVGIGDISDCPLGRLDTTPNKTPGSTWHLTAYPEAQNLGSRQYTGSIQVYVRITANVNGKEVHLDDAWVYGSEIPADGTYRRITYLSFKHIAIVGVNVNVACANDVTSCSGEEPSVPPTQSHAAAIASTLPPTATRATTATQYTTTAATTTTAMTQNTYAVPGNEATGIKLPECIGAGLAAGTCTAILLSLVTGIVTCCICKYARRRKVLQRRQSVGDEARLVATPCHNSAFLDQQPPEPMYEEINCVYI